MAADDNVAAAMDRRPAPGCGGRLRGLRKPDRLATPTPPLRDPRHRRGGRPVARRRVLGPRARPSGRRNGLAAREGTSDWRRLAVRFDETAVRCDTPALRALADGVRAESLTAVEAMKAPGEVLRPVRLLRAASRAAGRQGTNCAHLAMVEHMVVDRTAMAYGTAKPSLAGLRSGPACAYETGRSLTQAIRHAAKEAAAQCCETPIRRSAPASRRTRPNLGQEAEPAVPEGRVLACPSLNLEHPRTRDAVRGHEHVVGVALPWRPCHISRRSGTRGRSSTPKQSTRSIACCRRSSAAPWSVPPTIVVGPGSGTSRFVRRLSASLGAGLWRTDRTHSDGNTFGGTDLRWWSKEPWAWLPGRHPGQDREPGRPGQRTRQGDREHGPWAVVGRCPASSATGDRSRLSEPVAVQVDLDPVGRILCDDRQLHRPPSGTLPRQVPGSRVPRPLAGRPRPATPAAHTRPRRWDGHGSSLGRAAHGRGARHGRRAVAQRVRVTSRPLLGAVIQGRERLRPRHQRRALIQPPTPSYPGCIPGPSDPKPRTKHARRDVDRQRRRVRDRVRPAGPASQARVRPSVGCTRRCRRTRNHLWSAYLWP